MSLTVQIILWINRGAGWVLLWHLLHRAPNEEQESCSRLDFFLEISACHYNHSRISHFPVNLCLPFSLLFFLIIVGILYCMRDHNERPRRRIYTIQQQWSAKTRGFVRPAHASVAFQCDMPTTPPWQTTRTSHRWPRKRLFASPRAVAGVIPELSKTYFCLLKPSVSGLLRCNNTCQSLVLLGAMYTWTVYGVLCVVFW